MQHSGGTLVSNFEKYRFIAYWICKLYWIAFFAGDQSQASLLQSKISQLGSDPNDRSKARPNNCHCWIFDSDETKTIWEFVP
jgi:hypothetical protein